LHSRGDIHGDADRRGYIRRLMRWPQKGPKRLPRERYVSSSHSPRDGQLAS
jgi:hypothetical protein